MNLNDLPITMDDSTTPPEPQHHVASSFIDVFLEAMTKHIDMLVETKFNAMVENRRALTLMDHALDIMIDEKIERKIDDAITHHEDNEEHHDLANIEQIAADQARETLKEYAERQEGWVTKDQVQDIITEHVDEDLDRIDWDEKIKDVIRDML